jgi:hypothetical protein
MHKIGFLIAAALFLGVCSSSAALAGTVSYVQSLNALMFNGAIGGTDAKDLEAAYDRSAQKPTLVYFDSPGGDFYSAMKIGRWIRAKGLDSYAGQLCESACGYAWLGGVRKFANHVVSIHAPYMRTSQVTVTVPAEGLVDTAWYLGELGYDRTLVNAVFAVGTTESDECFPITGPNTHYLNVLYSHFDETALKDALSLSRQSKE